MKRYIKIAFVTTIFMLVLGVTGVIALSGLSRESKKEEQNKELRELDFVNSQNEKQEIKEHSVTTLSAGAGNLKQFETEKTDTVYSVSHSDKVMKQLNKWKKREKYTFKNPLFAENPFGTNTLGLYVYWESSKKSYLSYTIQTEGEEIANFNRTVYEDTPDNLGVTHEHQIIGLVPGKINYLILRECNADGTVEDSAVYKIDLTGHALSKEAQLANDGISESHLPERGLYAIAGKSYLYFYDNSGVLRAAIPVEGKHGFRVEEMENKMLFSYGTGKYAVLSGIGRVNKIVKLSSRYIDEQEYVYNGYGQIWLIASEKKGKTKKDQIVSLDINTGKTKSLIDMKKLWKKVYQKKKGKDWIGLNSLALSGSSDIIVSSKTFSSLIKINGITGYTPGIQYVIAEDKTLSSVSSVKKKLLHKSSYENGAWSEKKGTFRALYHPCSVVKVDDHSLGEGQYYIVLYNKSKDGKTAGYYQLLIDENAGNYALADKSELPYSETGGSVQLLGENRIAFSNTKKSLSEYDQTGYRIQSFDLSQLSIGRLTESRKYTMDKIWFQ